VDVPDVRYAWSGDAAIAYQLVGDGPPDLVVLPFLANLYTLWLAPRFEPIALRRATGRRLILVNPRGAGLSDRPLVAGSGIRFADRGLRELKGIPGEWGIYSVVDG
jgi:pimeloyl-ACP methyl ester carboxylesterase